MNDFKEIYQNSINALPKYSIDVESILDEMEHKKRVNQRKKQRAISSLLSFALIFGCGVGSVSAANYFQNMIEVTQDGFRSGDAKTMKNAESPEMAAEIGADSPVAPLEAPIPTENMESVETSGFREYDSWESFEEQETIAFARPQIPEQEIEELNIQVEVYMEGVQFYQRGKDGKVVIGSMRNYDETSAHSSATVYGDSVTNQREYTTKQGFAYTLIDTEGEAENDLGIHGAIAIGSYEIFIDFWGYTEEEALQMIESMDLTVYKVTDK